MHCPGCGKEILTVAWFGDFESSPGLAERLAQVLPLTYEPITIADFLSAKGQTVNLRAEKWVFWGDKDNRAIICHGLPENGVAADFVHVRVSVNGRVQERLAFAKARPNTLETIDFVGGHYG